MKFEVSPRHLIAGPRPDRLSGSQKRQNTSLPTESFIKISYEHPLNISVDRLPPTSKLSRKWPTG